MLWKPSDEIVVDGEKIQNCHHFHKSPQSTLGGGGQWLPYAYLNVDYDAMYFHTRLLKINIFKVLFWEGVTQKRVLYVHF